MSNELDFIRQRLQIVKQRLDDPTARMERIDRIQLEREHRLLGRVLAEVEEGQVMRTLQAWRRHLGGELADYSRRVLPGIRRAHDEWRRLPPGRRDETPEPPRPVAATRITDRNGYTWVIDDRFLMTLDGVIERLGKWGASGE